MHRLARGLATAAGCFKTTSAATRLAANWQHSAVARSTLLPWSTSRRTIHVRVPLPYKVEDGMGDFLSPAALKVIAEDYQQGLLDRLNEQIKGTVTAFFSLHELRINGLWAGEDRYPPGKYERRSNSHLHCPTREPNACIQLCESRPQQ